MEILTAEDFSTVLNMLVHPIMAILFNLTLLECLSCPFAAWYSVLSCSGSGDQFAPCTAHEEPYPEALQCSLVMVSFGASSLLPLLSVLLELSYLQVTASPVTVGWFRLAGHVGAGNPAR